MKINCGPTREEKREQKKKWHFWFAWYPIRIMGTDTCIWLEYVHRKGTFHTYMYDPYSVWEYREH